MVRHFDNLKNDIIILTDELSDRCGICRAVSTFSFAFEGKNSIFTASFNPDTCPIQSEWKVNVVNTDSNYSLDANSNYSLVWKLAILVWKLAIALKSLHSSKEIFLNTHGLVSHFPAAIYKLLFNRRAKILASIYDAEQLAPEILLAKIWFFGFCLLVKLNIIDSVLVLDNEMKMRVMKSLGPLSVDVIRIGIHPYILNKYEYRAVKESEEFILYFHGIIIPRRKIEVALKAIGMIENSLNRKLHLKISGNILDKHYYEYIKSVSDELESKVTFLGSISDDELICHYRGCDTFIWPASPQTWGLAPLEAMSFGKPVIVSKGSGVSEVLNNDVALLVSPDSPIEFANAISLLVSDEQTRSKIGKAARTFVLEHMTYKNTEDDLMRIFEKLA